MIVVMPASPWDISLADREGGRLLAKKRVYQGHVHDNHDHKNDDANEDDNHPGVRIPRN